MKLADKIKYGLMQWCKGSGYEIVIPNFYIGSYEMDVFRLMPSGIVIEYEIKISRSDFKNDFKKGYKTGGYGGKPEVVNLKHDAIKNGDRKCNRFFFVVPKGLVSPDEVPSYCGLIYYDEQGEYFNLVRNAPIIRKEREQPNYLNIAQRLAFRESIAQNNSRYYKRGVDRLQKEINELKNAK